MPSTVTSGRSSFLSFSCNQHQRQIRDSAARIDGKVFKLFSITARKMLCLKHLEWNIKEADMIENVKGLEFCGAAFSEKTVFTFFPSENARLSEIYPRVQR